MLVSQDNKNRRTAASVIANQLAHVGFTQVFDETLPDAFLTPVASTFDALLQPCSVPGWNAYFGSRAAAALDEIGFQLAQDVFLIALEEAFAEIPRARLAYRKHGDIDRLLGAVLPRIAFILEHAASLLGHADGAERAPFEGAATLELKVRTLELHAWFMDYRRDLAYLWNRRGRWESYEEFLALNRHPARLLWPFSIFIWVKPDGQCQVDVPIEVDVEALKSNGSSAIGLGSC
ncbi:MAG: hypothetical protein ACLPX8_00565 [Bryobacteraceae bacterium]